MMTTNRVVLMLVVLLATPQRAESREPATERRLEQLYQQATAAFRDQRFPDALEYYLEMERLGPQESELPRLHANLGVILDRLGRYEEARKYFIKALTRERDPAQRRWVEGRVVEMDRLSHGDLDVRCQPEGVHLELVHKPDGRVVRQGTCPIVWATLPRGEYTLEAILPAEPSDPTRRWVDDRRRSVTAEVAGGRRNTSDIAWKSEIAVSAPPRSRISIDDRLMTGPGPYTVERGEHTIRIEAPGRPPWSTTKAPSAGERVGVRLPDAAPSAASPSIEPESRLAPWLVGAGAVLAATTGGIFGAVTHQRFSDAESRYRKGYPGCCKPPEVEAAREEANDLKSQGQTFETIAWTSGGLALALGGLALYLALDADDSQSITPRVDPTSAAVQWSFSW